MKAYTDINQSKELTEILPLKSADMGWYYSRNPLAANNQMWVGTKSENADIPCWSLAALLSIIKDKCSYFELVYLKSTIDGRANRLENVHRLSTDIYDTYEKEAIDACYEMIIKLHELNLL